MSAKCILCDFLFFFLSANIVYLNEVHLSFVVSFLSSVHQAIFELSQGEQDLIEDLKLAKKVHSGFHFILHENF